MGRSFRLGGRVFLLVLAAGLVAFSACSPSAPAPPTAAPRSEEPAGPAPFADVTVESGIGFTYRNGEEAGHFAIIESLGGGVGLLDYDGDGLLDVFLPGGGHYDGKKVLGHPCKLFRNAGGFKFEDVSAAVGLDKVAFPYSHGAAAFDFDRDGFTDLLVTGYNRLVLLRNEPNGKGGRTFADVTKKAGLADGLWSTSAAWGDLDGDGCPEIYVAHYGDWGFETNHPTDCTYDGDGCPEIYVAHYGDWGFETNHPTDCTYDGKARDVCQPRRFQPLPHALYRNNRDGTFADVSDAVKLRKDGKGIGVLFVDVDNDGRPDVYVANDTDDNFLYLNRGPGALALAEVGLLAGVARDDRGVANGSMGIDAGDFDRSGRAALFVTNYENELPALYKNRTEPGRAQFTYDSQRSGVGAVGGSYVSWGTGFLDVDLDGWEDLFIVSGHAIRFPTKIDRRQRPVLLRNEGGKFKQLSTNGWAYLGEPHNARGAAFGDLDNDGKPDAVVSHLNEPVVVLRNVSPARNWVGVRLLREKGADAVGARVVLESAGGRQTRFVRGGASYASTNDPRLLFGLGADAKIEKVTVYWPSGKAQEVAGLEPGAYWDVTEGAAQPARANQPRP